MISLVRALWRRDRSAACAGLVLATLMLTAGCAETSTAEIGGTLDADTTLRPQEPPLRVTSDLVVPPGITLTIEPGTVLRFDSETALVVRGRLAAAGREDAPVRFVPDDPAQPWRGLRFYDSQADNRVAWVEMEGARSSDRGVFVGRSRLLIEHTLWRDIDVNVIETDHPRLIVRDCVFPNTGDAEVIDGEGLDPDAYLIIERNTFAATEGEDIIDQTGGRRPGAILQVLDNVFLGGNDDALDLDGTDAHVEGNTFRNFHAGPGVSGTSNAIASDKGAFIVVARNVFVDCDHALLAKRGARMLIEHNTFVDCRIAAIHLNELGRNYRAGRGVTIVGSIFSGNTRVFGEVDNARITIDHCLLPAEWHERGAENLDADPMFVDPPDDLHLRPGSPAAGRAAMGLDLGAYVPAGPRLWNVPTQPTRSADADLIVGGPGVTEYRSRINGGPWSNPTSRDNVLEVRGLSPGPCQVEVIGRSSAGVWLEALPATATWEVLPADG